jgi:hypothetical protein
VKLACVDIGSTCTKAGLLASDQPHAAAGLARSLLNPAAQEVNPPAG